MKDRKLLNIELGRVRPDEYASLPPSGLVLVLDNIRSAHNVGSIFRSGDAFKVDKLYLCGISAVPPSAEIHKSALGSERRFVDFCGRWHGTDAAEIYLVRLEGVAAAENASHIVRAAYIVQHQHQPGRGQRRVFVRPHAAELNI